MVFALLRAAECALKYYETCACVFSFRLLYIIMVCNTASPTTCALLLFIYKFSSFQWAPLAMRPHKNMHILYRHTQI